MKWDKYQSVEPSYFELGYLKFPSTSDIIAFALDFAFVFQSFHLEHPAISNCCLLPLAQINPISNLIMVQRTLVKISQEKCSQGTSWQDVQNAEKRLTHLW